METSPSEAGPSAEEAAAIIAAVERFARDMAPPAAAAPAPALSPWRRAALAEGVRRAPFPAPEAATPS